MARRTFLHPLKWIRQGLRFTPAIAGIGFLIAIALVFTAAALNDRYAASIQENFIATGHQRDTINDLVDLDDELDNATSSARAFLLSGDHDHLIPYAAAAAASRALLDRIEANQRQVNAPATEFVHQARSYLASLELIVNKLQQGDRRRALSAAGPDLGRAAKAALQAEIHSQRELMTESVVQRRASITRELSAARRVNLLAAVAVAAVLVLFGALLRHYFRETQDGYRALAAVNATLEQTIRRRTAELADLSQHLLTVREEERAELARDIHDQIGSELTALRMDCARLEGASTGHNPLASTTWPRIRKALDELTLAHRRIINSLHPTVLDHLGLEAAIRQLLAERLSTESLTHSIAVRGGTENLRPEVAIAAYRVVQEALSNVVKHSNASHVSVALRRHGSTLSVHVSDDGTGIPAGSRAGGRMGLVGMRERARKLGGSFRVTVGPGGHGTRVTARFRCNLARNAESPPRQKTDD